LDNLPFYAKRIREFYGASMKRVLLGVGLLGFAIASSGANGYSGYDVENHQKSIEEMVDSPKSGKEALEGFFCGVGLIKSSSTGKTTNIEHIYEWSGDVDYMAAPDEIAVGADLIPRHIVGDMDLGKAGDHLVWLRVTGQDRRRVAEGKSNKVGGSIAAEYGQFVDGDVYLGGKLLVDFAGNKKVQETDGDSAKGYGSVKVKSHGIRPSAAAILGIYSSQLDGLLYAKFGACHVKAEAHSDYGNVKLSKLTPVAGIGIKKNIEGDLSLSLEFDYAFQTNKIGTLKRDVPVLLAAGTPAALNYSSKVRVRSKGYAVRLTLMYQI
jgi:hypothetical protein